MNTPAYIAQTIDRLPKGYVFTYTDFVSEVYGKEAVIKALNRMAASGTIQKLAKGKFYKPERSPFGNLAPPQYQIVKDFLESNGKCIGYLTGYSVYNQLGLTTQVSAILHIGKNDIRSSVRREGYTISFIKQKNIITKDTIPLLQILDALRYIKKIPGTTIPQAVKRLEVLIAERTEQEQRTLVRLAQKYPPATRALLGAILDNAKANNTDLTSALRASLNPISVYELPGAQEVLPTASAWNIR